KGDVVVFLHGGQPWVSPTNGAGKPTPLFIDRGRVGSLSWSPDGTRIAFVSTPSDPIVPFTSDREGTPWEIWVADAATGQGRRLWRAAEGVGSRFRPLFNSRDSIFWGAGDRLVFPWEVTGWVRLYS